MQVHVELYGIPRQRARAEHARVELDAATASLGDVLESLAVRFPELAAACFDGRRLKSGYVANVDGKQFLRDPEARLSDGDCLLILSADAGG